MTISAVLLAGGIGKRMGSDIPKQFLMLKGKPIALHSLNVLHKHEAISEIIVVCDAKHRYHFEDCNVAFADPGERRQDSLYNGLKKCSSSSTFICVHDAARPFIYRQMLDSLFQEGKKMGAATVGMPLKWTVKEASADGIVQRTLDRDKLWEIQTPQILKRELLEKGFAYAQSKNLTVTDDVSLAELLGHPVKMVLGSYQNIKITTPEDLLVAQCININF